MLLVTGVVGVLGYGVSALVAGWRWPLQWLELVRFNHFVDAELGFEHFTTWYGIAGRIFGPFSGPAMALGLGLTAVTVALLVAVWLRVEARPETKPYLFGVVVSGMLLLALHVVWYDVSLVLLPLLFLVERYRWQAALQLLVLWPLAIFVDVAAALGFSLRQLLFLLPLAVLVLSLRTLYVESRSSPSKVGR